MSLVSFLAYMIFSGLISLQRFRKIILPVIDPFIRADVVEGFHCLLEDAKKLLIRDESFLSFASVDLLLKISVR
jgi:hypothetical protein